MGWPWGCLATRCQIPMLFLTMRPKHRGALGLEGTTPLGGVSHLLDTECRGKGPDLRGRCGSDRIARMRIVLFMSLRARAPV